ncbi:MAG: HEAT repeat domain-containing protein [Chloroflexota bacterium]
MTPEQFSQPTPASSTDIDTLISYLQSDDVRYRQQAAIELSRLDDARVIAPLQTALTDADSTVRANAATAMGIHKVTEAVETLITLLRDDEDIVRERAATALAQIGDPRSIPALLDALEDSGTWARNRIIYVLGASQAAEAVEPLIVELDNDDVSTRGVAAWALGAIGDLRALPPLTELLSSDNASVRGNAAYALGELGQAESIPQLIAQLEDTSAEVRAKTAWALGNLSEATDDTSMVENLIALLDDYAEIQNESAHVFVCQYAAESLAQIGTHDAQTAIDAWRPTAREKLLPRRIADLIRALQHHDLETRQRAIAGLQEIGQPAVQALITALREHDNVRVRQGAAQALGELGASDASGALALALADPDIGVWSQAVAALAKIGNEKPLRPALSSKKDRVRMGVAIALWRISREEKAFTTVLSAIQSDDVVIRGSAITSLWMQPEERAVATLQIQLGKEDVGSMMAKYILQALDTIGGSMATATIANYLAENRDNMR